MSSAGLIQNKRILFVDDEPDILDAVEDLLPMCDVVKASTFDEAKKLLDTEYYDMCILDIMGVKGFDLLKIATKKEVIAVMLTAHANSPENAAKSFKEGAAFYVPKEKMTDIAVYLNDILESIEAGKSPWSRWWNRIGRYMDEKFGAKWKDKDIEFWERFQ